MTPNMIEPSEVAAPAEGDEVLGIEPLIRLSDYEALQAECEKLQGYAARRALSRERVTAMVDAAMLEMKNIHPPLLCTDCERLIRAALQEASTS